MTTKTALAPARDAALVNMADFLRARQKQIAEYVGSRLKPDVLIRLALWEFSQNKDLRACTPMSIYSALIGAAQLGLEPGSVKGEAYLVPFKGNCTLITGYRGLIKLALRSKAVRSVYAHVVYENDEFDLELGSAPRVHHRPELGDRGNGRGAYAVAHLANGAIDIEWMSVDDLRKIRDAAPSKNSPAYQDWAEEMYRKAPIRRLCKRLPLGDDFYRAETVDAAADAGERTPRFDVGGLPVDTDAAEENPANVDNDTLRDKVRAVANQGERHPPTLDPGTQPKGGPA